MKKKTRGIFVVLLVLLMTTSLFAQGQKAIQSPISEDNLLREGTQIVKEKITLTGFGSKYAGNAEWDDDMLVWRELEKQPIFALNGRPSLIPKREPKLRHSSRQTIYLTSSSRMRLTCLTSASFLNLAS